MTAIRPRVVLFDLLTALLDSWSAWNAAANSEQIGRAWRGAYLRLTYGCGAYVPYEDLVRRAAIEVGLSPAAADDLEARWDTLMPWSGAAELLEQLRPTAKLGIVTNCSIALGERAARRFDIAWDTIVTAEEAGYYKPDPRPYQLALAKLNVSAEDAVFVAGSGYDLFGTTAVGLRTFWHNRVGLPPPDGAPPAAFESRTFDGLVPWLEGST